jgi:cytochrome c553
MKVTNNQIKKLAVLLITLPMLAVFLLNSASVRTRAAGQEKDLGTVYKESKCLVCHGAKAEKKFDATLPEDQMLDAIMKGKKGEKPPNMPAYEAKGMTVDQAKALIGYMKSLKQ